MHCYCSCWFVAAVEAVHFFRSLEPYQHSVRACKLDQTGPRYILREVKPGQCMVIKSRWNKTVWSWRTQKTLSCIYQRVSGRLETLKLQSIMYWNQGRQNYQSCFSTPQLDAMKPYLCLDSTNHLRGSQIKKRHMKSKRKETRKWFSTKMANESTWKYSKEEKE